MKTSKQKNRRIENKNDGKIFINFKWYLFIHTHTHTLNLNLSRFVYAGEKYTVFFGDSDDDDDDEVHSTSIV